MEIEDRVQIVIAAITASVEPDFPLTCDTKLSEAGLDSLAILDVVLEIEDRIPEADLFDYVPGESDTILDVVTQIEKRIKP